MSKKAKVLLLKPLSGKGNAGEVVEVKSHFANYVLIPQGTAIYYDKQAQNQHKAHAKKVEAFKAEMKKTVQEIATKLEKDGITYTKVATESGSLYDSISARTLSKYALDEFNTILAPEYFTLDPKIESLGEYTADFKYEDVAITFAIIVEREGGPTEADLNKDLVIEAPVVEEESQEEETEE